MLNQHIGVRCFGHYRATIYAMEYNAMPCHAMPCHAMPCHAMPDIAKLRMKTLHFRERHGINASAENFCVSIRV